MKNVRALVPCLLLCVAAPAYGQSGFEFALGSKPVDSSGTMTVQLLDQAGLPLSGVNTFETYSDCTKNLPIVRFEQVR